MTKKMVDARLSGKRKQVPHLPGLRFPLVWPADVPDQWGALRDWARIAMQILQREKVSFRLVTVIPWVIDPATGAVYLTDDDLADAAGRCGAKSISRDISAYKALGLIVTEYGKRTKDGKVSPMRIIRTAVPEQFPPYVSF